MHCEMIKWVAWNCVASSAVGTSAWKEPSRNSKPPLEYSLIAPSASLLRSVPGRMKPVSAQDTWTADATSTFGVMM